MNTVWVLIVLASNGHFLRNVIPTLEFTSQERCIAAIRAFEDEAKKDTGYVNMRCVRIEK